jgi:hypothetical protein
MMNEVYVPTLFKLMEEGCAELRNRSAENLLSFVQVNVIHDRREGIF